MSWLLFLRQYCVQMNNAYVHVFQFGLFVGGGGQEMGVKIWAWDFLPKHSMTWAAPLGLSGFDYLVKITI
jgi:hypothetical protein